MNRDIAVARKAFEKQDVLLAIKAHQTNKEHSAEAHGG